VADPLKQAPNPYVLPRQIWLLCFKGCTAKYKGTLKIGERWAPPLTVEMLMTRKKYDPSSRVFLPNLIVLGQTVRSLFKLIRLKKI